MKKAVWTYLAAAILFMLLGVLLFGNVLLLRVVPGSPDSVTPLALSKALDALQASSGRYPLWEPWTFSGMPTVEAFSYLSGLYLPNLLFDLLHLDGVYTQWLHLVFAGMGGYLLSRRLGQHGLPAFLAGSAFMLNPFMAAMFAFGHGSQLMTASYMPWVLWAALRLAERSRIADAGILALLLGLQLQRAHVQIAWYTWLLVVPFLLLLAVVLRTAGEKPLKRGLLALAALLFGIALSLQVYLPALDYLPASSRAIAGDADAAYSYATMWSMHPAELLTYLLPGAFGFGGITYWGFMPFTDFPHYAGIVVLILAVAGAVAGRKQPVVLFFAAAALLFLLLSFGSWFSPVYDLFYHFAPLFKSFRVPSMALVGLALCLAQLAGFGLQALVDRPLAEDSPVLRSSAALLGVAAILFLFLEGTLEQFLRGQFPLVQVESPEIVAMVGNLRWSLWQGSFFIMLMGAGAVAGLSWLSARKMIDPLHAALLLVLISSADLLMIDRQLLFPGDRDLRPSPFVERSQLDRALGPDEVTEFLSRQPGDFRIYPVGQLFSENKFAIYGIESVGGYHAAKLGSYQVFLARTSNLASIDVLRMLNVRFVVSPGPLDYPELSEAMGGVLRTAGGDVPVTVYRLEGTLPRAWFASEVSSVSGDAVGVDELLAGRGRPGGVWATGVPWLGTKRFADGTMLDLRRSPESIVLKVRSAGESFLVLSEIHYPERWRLTVDGKTQKAARVNGLIRGVPLPAGEHEVRFSYDRSRFDTGRAISTASAAAVLLLIAGGALFERRNPRKQPNDKQQ